MTQKGFARLLPKQMRFFPSKGMVFSRSAISSAARWVSPRGCPTSACRRHRAGPRPAKGAWPGRFEVEEHRRDGSPRHQGVGQSRTSPPPSPPPPPPSPPARPPSPPPAPASLLQVNASATCRRLHAARSGSCLQPRTMLDAAGGKGAGSRSPRDGSAGRAGPCCMRTAPEVYGIIASRRCDGDAAGDDGATMAGRPRESSLPCWREALFTLVAMAARRNLGPGCPSEGCNAVAV